MSSLYLGLDSSTQSLSAIIIDLDTRQVVYDAALNYDETLPHYGTQNGVLDNPDPKIVHSPPLMWVEALDALFDKMKTEGVALGDIQAISGSGQQHGSVYLKSEAASVLSNLDPSKSLTQNLDGEFSRDTSPIWMDSSTRAECDEICDALGGLQATTEATGSTTFERFTGPQIRKFYKMEPNAYNDTAHIMLVSSFMASILAGTVAPIDHGDGAGMNLMDIQNRTWHSAALEAAASNLSDRLPPLAESWTVIGPVSPYFVDKYGLNPQAQALTWSGDNPNSIVGLGLIREGLVAISLGTSDTYFGTMKACQTDPRGEGHVFVSPTGDYMTLICFKNGSLAREAIRESHGLDWNDFSQALQSTPSGNDGKIMLPYFEPEIVPNVLEPSVHRFDLDKNDASGNCRAVVEAQMMSMRVHSEWMGVRPSAIYVTGGASVNPEILQIMADVQNCPVHQFEVINSAALGAALRAAHGLLNASGQNTSWEAITKGIAEPISASTVEPSNTSVYDELVKKYAECEQSALDN
jgi:xylulokinase